MGATILWFRQDLRLEDHGALAAAAARNQALLPLYIWSPEEEGGWPPGAASRWWLHESLRSLERSLRQRGLRLILRRGPALAALRQLLTESRAEAVYWSRRYEPAAAAVSRMIQQQLRGAGVEVRSFSGTLLAEPSELLNLSGQPYQVYTPFMRRLRQTLEPPAPLPVPATLRAPARWPASLKLEDLGLLPRVPWYEGMARLWRPGEAGAAERLEQFLRQRLADYARRRDQPAVAGTSALSPHLHFGEIGPRQIWHALGARGRESSFLNELLWREFAYHLLHHFPATPERPLREEFLHFRWAPGLEGLEAWQHGRTGVPMVDAGMRELWATGVMHNRARMIAASFLVKHLRLPWQEGARWFWDTLLDADLASNTLNWQWVAGCGADAAPYVRIFNPVLQGQRFDPDGHYVRRWITELSGLAAKQVHAPWLAENPPAGYPAPMVDLAKSRQAALAAFAALRAEFAR